MIRAQRRYIYTSCPLSFLRPRAWAVEFAGSLTLSIHTLCLHFLHLYLFRWRLCVCVLSLRSPSRNRVNETERNCSRQGNVKQNILLQLCPPLSDMMSRVSFRRQTARATDTESGGGVVYRKYSLFFCHISFEKETKKKNIRSHSNQALAYGVSWSEQESDRAKVRDAHGSRWWWWGYTQSSYMLPHTDTHIHRDSINYTIHRKFSI